MLAEQTRGWRVAFCSAEAWRLGVRPGWPLAEARVALAPRRGIPKAKAAWLRTEREADQEALQQLARQAQQFTPFVGLADEESLLLDIAGCAHLWGDESGLLTAVREAMRPHQIRLAVADTMGAAWALAHYGSTEPVIVGDDVGAALRPLPTAALRLSDKVVQSLASFGISTIGGVQDLPQQTLASRFGAELPTRLAQAFGRVPEHFTPERFAEPLTESWTGEEGCHSQPAISQLFGQLLEQIFQRLESPQVGVVEWRCSFPTASGTIDWEFHLSRPSIDRPHLETLFRLRCERDGLPEDCFGLHLTVLRVAWLRERQTSLFETEESTDRDWSALLDRLRSRLGDDAVIRPTYEPDPLPELACRWTSESAASFGGAAPTLLAISRPTRLLPSPEALQVVSVIPDGPPRRVFYQGELLTVHQSWGPERVEAGWWRTKDVRRDYYRIELESGLHWWIFRQADRWFLHGFFD